ncbi:MAG TPA: hypothetical protein VGI11_13320 [Variovorax sp.]|jgi:hypothetical protein
MLQELIDPFARIWSDITSGRHAPLSFRFVLQPAVAAFFAWRAGRDDARNGRPPFFWALFKDHPHWREHAREGWTHIGKVFIVAMVMDGVYQFIQVRWFYPFEALMVAVILAVLPYLVCRGLVNRALRGLQPHDPL